MLSFTGGLSLENFPCFTPSKDKKVEAKGRKSPDSKLSNAQERGSTCFPTFLPLFILYFLGSEAALINHFYFLLVV